mmetsp:Transcript_4470/g.4007  ORF Transcript_4470/g.4007 Transcript_4470/m.4007 type:complete len:177 (-) Transcript_4470:81-611(-)
MYYFDKNLFKSFVEYIIDEVNLKIIRYETIKGDHIAKNSKEFINILKQLKYLNENQIVHGDLRLYNMVFNHSDPSSSSLIDFDYCGIANKGNYPEGIIKVPDGIRTKSMLKGEQMNVESDITCMIACMDYFTSNNNKWKKCQELLKKNKYVKAIKVLENNESFDLVLQRSKLNNKS